MQSIPGLFGGFGRHHVQEKILSHGGEETAQELLILVIPPVIRRVRNLRDAVSTGRRDELWRCGIGSIDESDELDTSQIGEKLC
jgi:hypothetical protein